MINVSKWQGNVELNSLRFKQEFITDLATYLGFPLILNLGVIGSLRVSIPWTKIWRDPVKIAIRDVVIVCSTTQFYQHAFKRAQRDRVQQGLLDQLNASFAQQFSQQQGHPEPYRIVRNLKRFVLENIRVEVHRVHLRIEDDRVSCPRSQFALGLYVDQAFFKPTDERYQDVGPNKRESEKGHFFLLDVLGLSLYMQQYKNGEPTWTQIPDLHQDPVTFSNDWMRKLLNEEAFFRRHIVAPLDITFRRALLAQTPPSTDQTPAVIID